MNDLNRLTIREALDGLRQKKFTEREIAEAGLTAIATRDPKLHAFLSTAPSFRDGDNLRGPLRGLPIALKDNILCLPFKATAASKVLADYEPPYEATAARRLKGEGAFVIGKTNLDAWAHGSSTEASDFGPTANPWDLGRLPGGSSGGSAAAVSADLCLASLGTETAGSIRQPASWCGVVGLKPTYGRVSRYGIIAMASSTDSPGPITKTVWDAAYLLKILSGKDPYDGTSLTEPVPDFTRDLEGTVAGIRIGVPKEYFGEGVDQKVSACVFASLKVLESQGVQVKEISLLEPKYSIAAYTILQRSEVSSNLARYDGVRYGSGREIFGEEAKRRMMLGTFSLSAGYYDAYYKRAERVRTLIVEDFEKAFGEVDLIAGPVSPTVALPKGASRDQAMFGEMADALVEPSSIAGLPGISLPCGFVDKLPVGLGFIGPRLSEELILRVAHRYERETEWHKMRPRQV